MGKVLGLGGFGEIDRGCAAVEIPSPHGHVNVFHIPEILGKSGQLSNSNIEVQIFDLNRMFCA